MVEVLCEDALKGDYSFGEWGAEKESIAKLVHLYTTYNDKLLKKFFFGFEE